MVIIAIGKCFLKKPIIVATFSLALIVSDTECVCERKFIILLKSQLACLLARQDSDSSKVSCEWQPTLRA